MPDSQATLHDLITDVILFYVILAVGKGKIGGQVGIEHIVPVQGSEYAPVMIFNF